MPSIVTRGAASARGFGFNANPVYRIEKLLQNTTWTAPAGVTSIATVTGKGQDGTAAYWQDFADGLLFTNPQKSMAYVQVGYAGSQFDGESTANAAAAALPTSSSDPPTVCSWVSRAYYASGFINSFGYTKLVRVKPGTSRTNSGNGWGATWTPPAPANYNYALENLQYQVDAVTGADTTGFGYTFAGGVGGPASVTTYNNVPVTPGTTYTITSTGDGYIYIVYFYQGG